MKKTNIFILFILLLFSYSCKNEKQNKSSDKKSNEIEEVSIKDTTHNSSAFNCYVIIDNSLSTVNDKVEKVDLSFFTKLGQIIANKGGGKLWLSFIDANSKDNKGEYCKIPTYPIKPQKPIKPNEKEYTSLKYSEVFKKYKKDFSSYKTKVSQYNMSLKKIDKEIVNNTSIFGKLLNSIYKKKPRWSDCNIALKAAEKALTPQKGEKVIIAFSDLKHDANKVKFTKKNSSIIIIRSYHSTEIPEFEWINYEVSNKDDVLSILKNQNY